MKRNIIYVVTLSYRYTNDRSGQQYTSFRTYRIIGAQTPQAAENFAVNFTLSNSLPEFKPAVYVLNTTEVYCNDVSDVQVNEAASRRYRIVSDSLARRNTHTLHMTLVFTNTRRPSWYKDAHSDNAYF